MFLNTARYRDDHEQIRSPNPDMAPPSDTLGTFASHTLEAQASVVLPDRIDSKFLMPLELLPKVLATLDQEYTVLESGGTRVFTYENTYLDTPQWHYYLDHHNGKLTRHKYRYRRYRETDVSFLETKLKTNTQRTVKKRARWPSPEANEVVGALSLQAQLYVNYRRVTFWCNSIQERLTMDFDLRFSRPGSETFKYILDYFVTEQKCESRVGGSPFARFVRKHSYLPVSLSKYCIGACMTDRNGTLKKNRFKPMLRRLPVQQIELAA